MKKRIIKISLLILGIAAFALAVIFAFHGADFSAIRQASPLHILGLAAGVLGNLLLTGILFWAVTRPFDCCPPVTLSRMQSLILSSSVLNYLPLRMGLIGRAAYLKQFHQLPLKQSAQILIIVLGLGAMVLGSVGLAVIAIPQMDQMTVILLTSALVVALSPIWKRIFNQVARRKLHEARVLGWLSIRITDMFVVGMRTWFAFAIIGQPITFAQATALGAAGMLISLLGLTPNGLGLREWALAGMTMLVSQHDASVGATAALVDRAVEAVVVCVLGLPTSWQLMRQMAREKSAENSENLPETS
ncbi:MAG: hypothetical protein CMJ19_12170 [Phycisphaeraceae bacterium]|nr:hypothetical protein [Phycisphaeraceae bacterium]